MDNYDKSYVFFLLNLIVYELQGNVLWFLVAMGWFVMMIAEWGLGARSDKRNRGR